MRKAIDPQRQLGEVGIEDIELDFRSRDDIPALPVGLQHPCSDEAFRGRLFALMDEHILPDVSRKTGRPDMEMWRILVMGVVKQGLGCDFDRLHELLNEHRTLRRFLGHADIRDTERDDPARREGVPGLRAAHAVDIEGEGGMLLWNSASRSDFSRTSTGSCPSRGQVGGR